MYDLIEYKDNYLPALTDAGTIKNFHVGGDKIASFKLKQKITGK